MIFKLKERSGKTFFIFILIYLLISAVLIREVSRENTNLILIIGFLLLIGLLFIVSLYVGNKTPFIKLEIDGIYLERKFLGCTINSNKVTNFDRLLIKLKNDEMKLYPIKRVLFLFRFCILKAVDPSSKSYLRRWTGFQIIDFKQFVETIFRRVKYAEIDKASHEIAEKLGLPLGLNIALVGQSAKNAKDLSQAQRFVKYFFRSKRTK